MDEICVCGHPKEAHYVYSLCFAMDHSEDDLCTCEEFRPILEMEI